MVEIARIISLAGFIYAKIVNIGGSSSVAFISKCSIVGHSSIVSCIGGKTIAAKYLAKCVAIIGGQALYTGVLAGIAFFATGRIYNNRKQQNDKKQFVHVTDLQL
jgi:hypothetical protein